MAVPPAAASTAPTTVGANTKITAATPPAAAAMNAPLPISLIAALKSGSDGKNCTTASQVCTDYLIIKPLCSLLTRVFIV